MKEQVIILSIDNDLDKLGIIHLLSKKLDNTLMLEAEDLHVVHKLLFQYNDAVVIISTYMLENENIKQAKALTTCFPNAKWLYLSDDLPDENFIAEFLQENNLINIVLTTDSAPVINEAFFACLHNRPFITHEILELLTITKKRKKTGGNKRNLLTSTELEIIQLIVQGKTAKEIAELRCLSYHTVNTHRKNIFRKLEINNVQELIKYALKIGLVDLTEYYI